MIAITLLCAALAAAPARAQPDRIAPGATEDRAVEQYLDRLGMAELLIIQLEDRLKRAQGADRLAIASRLAALIVERLDAATDDAQRRRWERKGRALLAAVPEADSFDLRLDLHRATYARAEQIAERWRVGLATPGEREEAERILTTLARELAAIGAEADQIALRLQREEERSGRQAQELLAVHIADVRRQRSLAMYLAGWCNAYLADLTNTPGRAEEALRQFGWLLGAQPGRPPTITRVPERTLQYEHVARSALGVALCNALLQRRQDALDWLGLLETVEGVSPAVTAQVPLWRIVALARLGLWEELAGHIERRRWRPQDRRYAPLAPTEARLLAALTLGVDPPAAGGASAEAGVAALRDTALSDLIAAGELAAVVQAASGVGTRRLPDTGFVGHCVRGLLLFEQARSAPEGSEQRAVFLRAADALRIAMESDDASAFAAAAPEVAMTRALALHRAAALGESAARRDREEAGRRLVEASGLFEAAAADMATGARAAEAMWMAIHCLDEAKRLAAAAIDEGRRDRLAAAFLAAHPNHEAAGVLLLGAALQEDAPEEIIARLQRVPAGSPAHEAARRHIARLLYDQFRASSEQDRSWAALRYADAAESLFADDLRRALAGDHEAAPRALTRGRRLLAALMSAIPPDAVRAARVLRGVRDMAGARLVDVADIQGELLFREAQIAIARGEMAAAEHTLRSMRYSALSAGDEESLRMAAALERSMFAAVTRAWRDARRTGADADRSTALARDVMRAGERVLDAGSALDEDVRRTTRAIVGEAAHDVWRLTRSDGALTIAHAMHRALLDDGVEDPGVLRRAADLGEALERHDEAVDAWRTLAAGLDRTRPAWFEARYHFIRVMHLHDAARAVSLIEQHAILYPDYGPEPWGARLRELDERIRTGPRGETP